jgi:hypothetical protein
MIKKRIKKERFNLTLDLTKPKLFMGKNNRNQL